MKNFVPYLNNTFNDICHKGILKVLIRLGIEKYTGGSLSDFGKSIFVLDKYERLFKEVLRSLADSRYILIERDKITIPDNVKIELEHFDFSKVIEISISNNLAYSTHLRLLEICLASFEKIVRGEVKSTDIIFPEGNLSLVSGIYKGNPESDFYNEALCRFVKTSILENIDNLNDGEKFTILEVGAGTGGTSEILFKELQEFGEYIRYIYTDVSKSFLLYAENKYRAMAPYLETKLFNIEKWPEDPNIIGCCDIVIGANVVHATKDISATLYNIKAVLKQQGVLILNEIAQTEIFTTLTFGLLDGWWLYEDPEIRLKGSPGLSGNSWEKVLEETGFNDVLVYSKKGINTQQIIISQSDGELLTIPGKEILPDRNDQVPNPESIRSPKNNFNDYLIDQLHTIASDTLKLSKEEFRIDEQFSDLGFDSILGGQLVRNVNERLKIKLNPTDIFNYPNIKTLADYIGKNFTLSINREESQELGQNLSAESKVSETNGKQSEILSNEVDQKICENAYSSDDIAIIGISGEYGSAKNLEEYWEIIKSGKNIIEEVPSDRWSLADHYSPTKELGKTINCKWGTFLKDIDKFDPMFFKISGREAENMDPQHRFFLQHCWKALEDAGISPKKLNGMKCGVYVGAAQGDYMQDETKMDVSAFWGTTSSILASRISYYLNLKGPAVAINTACSSSLVAIDIACKSLKNGDTDIVLSGGISINITPGFYKMAGMAGMLSEDGRCYTFDHRANGFVPGEGVGVVVLKRLKDAENEGDRIYGIIKGIGTNQDGTTNGITAPSVLSQEQLEKDIYERYSIDPSTITYVESHGTGTSLGDPIEFEALTKSFKAKTNKIGYCALGSVKANIGHTLLAAGVAGVHKVLLCMKNGIIPPAVNFEKMNPLMDLEKSPFYINTELKKWETVSPKRAAVSSFGFSGTNAHLIIEEYVKEKREVRERDVPIVILLSARNQDQLRDVARNLLEYLTLNPTVSMADLAYTLQVGRDTMEERIAFRINSKEKLAGELRKFLSEEAGDFVRNEGKKSKGMSYSEESELSLRLKQAYEEKDASVLTELWIKGADINWQSLYNQDTRPEKISLPTYPFAKERYWIHTDSRNILVAEGERVHALVHRNISNLREQKFKSVFSGSETFLSDHVIARERILPGVAYLEMAREAGLQSTDQKITKIYDVVWMTPVKVNEEPKEIYTAIFPSDGVVSYEIFSNEGNEEIIHCQGKLSTSELEVLPKIDIEKLKAGFSLSKDRAFCYNLFKEVGFNYGSSFQGIETLFFKDNEALSKISLPSSDGYVLSPGIMDSAIQTCLGLSLDKDVFELAVPYSLREIIIYGNVGMAQWCYVKKTSREGRHDKVMNYDIDIIAKDGDLLVSLKGFIALPLNKKSFVEQDAKSKIEYYKREWLMNGEIMPVDKKGSQLILLAGGSPDLEDKIRENLEVEVFNIPSDTIENYFFKVNEQILSRISNDNNLNVVLLSESESYRDYSFISGLLKSIQLEYPQLSTKSICVDSLSLNRLDILLSTIEKELWDGATDVRYFNGVREVHSLVPLALTGNKDIEIKRGGIYLVAGGVDGFELPIAEFISSIKDTKIIFVCLDKPEIEEIYNHPDYKGWTCISCDFSKYDEVARLINSIRKDYGVLSGIIYNANSLGPKQSKLQTRFTTSILGAKYLDESTKDESLDFFVLFSSMAAISGCIGNAEFASANAWLDSFAQYRNELTIKGVRFGRSLSINWPLYLGEGVEAKRIKYSGSRTLPKDVVVEIFVKALNSKEVQILAEDKQLPVVKPILADGSALKEKSENERSEVVVESAQLKKQLIDLLKVHLAEVLKLPASKLDADEPFEKYGINSILITKLTDHLEGLFGRLPRTLFFEYQTIGELSGYFLHEHKTKVAELTGTDSQASKKSVTNIPDYTFERKPKLRFKEEPLSFKQRATEDIAIIGLSGRYPGAMNLNTFWENLKNGKDCISEIPLERWNVDGFYDERKDIKGRSYSKWGGFIEHADKFDSLFFNISPREAELIDPQERLFLQTVWETIEDAGYTRSMLQNVDRVKGPVGVYVGVMYEEYQLFGAEETLKGNPLSLSGSAGSIANRISYIFDFHGPSMALDTMCSSSLTAIHLACESLKNGSCSMAIAGGVNLSVHPNKYLLLSERRFMSAKGRCESFGIGGEGYVPGEGVGAVLLKPLDQAKADGDRIYGIIKGSSLNHGGKTNGYTVPNPNAQAKVIKEAMNRAGVKVEDFSYIEAHGTGTSLGDPIEIAGLVKAFDSDKKQYCSIGSVKSNIGHCESAAGVSSLTKVLLQMKYKKLVPSLHSKTLNPNIDFSKTSFRVQQNLEDWKPIGNKSRIAGISSFGAGGSNAHLIIEEYIKDNNSQYKSHDPVVIIFSAKNEERLLEYAGLLKECVLNDSEINIFNLAYTLQVGREPMEERIAMICESKSDLLKSLDLFISGIHESQSNIPFCRGNISEKAGLNLALDEDERDAYLSKFILDKNYSELAKIWVKGFDVDWNLLYTGSKPDKIGLPTYPFEKIRYWVPTEAEVQLKEDKFYEVDGKTKEIVFKQTFSGQELFLIDHKINNERMLPAAFYLELAYKALSARALPGAIFEIKDVSWLSPFSIDKGLSSIYLKAELRNQKYHYSINSGEGNNSTTYSSGVASFIDDKKTKFSIQNILDKCDERKYSGEYCYNLLQSKGLQYGPSHRLIENVYTGSGQALASIKLDDKNKSSLNEFYIHPGILDGAFQSTIALILSRDGEYFQGALPFALDSVKVYGKADTQMWAWSRFSSGVIANQDLIKVDIDLLNNQGELCLSLRGLNCRIFGGKGSFDRDEFSTICISPEWINKEPMEKASVKFDQKIVVSIGAPLNFNLSDRNHIHIDYSEGDKSTIYEELATKLFDVVKAQLQDIGRSKVLIQVLNLSESPLLDGLVGLLKSAKLENPFFYAQLISCDKNSVMNERILEENERCNDDTYIRYIGGKRYSQGWKEISDGDVSMPWKDFGTYIITGGLGGLGLIFANEIADSVQCPALILTGRSDIDADKERQLDLLKSKGALVEYHQVDISNSHALDKFVKRIISDHVSIEGIIHSAGVINDNVIIRKTSDSISKVFAPKVKGLANLNDVLGDMPLDFILLFSSGAGAMGNIGQSDYAMANAFMDRFANVRNIEVAKEERFGRTLTINWPLWKDGGMHVDAETEKILLKHFGMIPMRTSAGLKAFYKAWSSGLDQVMIIEGVEEKLRKLFNISDTSSKVLNNAMLSSEFELMND